MKPEFYECGPGWFKLIEPLVTYCKENNIKILQVKEKFGTLRFHCYPYPPEMANLIVDASKKSATTCEVCGEPGILETNHGWLKCLCEKHHQEREERMKKNDC